MALHIVFFNRSFYPDITATGQLLTELAEDLVRDYHCRITVITGRPLIQDTTYTPISLGKKLVETEIFRGIEILRVRNTVFSPVSFSGRILNYLTYFFLSFLASGKIKKPDLVVSLTDPPIIGLVGLWVARRFKVPFILSVRDIFPEAARALGGSGKNIIHLLLDYINRFSLNKADHVIVLGEMMREKLIEEKGAKPDKISIIPDWADCKNIFPQEKNNPFSLAHNLVEYFVVMYAGNSGASSGLTTLVKCALLLKDYPDILFVLIGEGIMKERLIALTQDYKLKNVRFFPYQPKDKLSHVFSSADVSVIPLKKDLAGYSLPSKVYSIMASGRPYVACVAEESELVWITREFDCGLIAEPDDHQDLAKKMLSLYTNKEQRLKMGENARKAAVFFDRSLQVKKYYELFNKICYGQENL